MHRLNFLFKKVNSDKAVELIHWVSLWIVTLTAFATVVGWSQYSAGDTMYMYMEIYNYLIGGGINHNESE